MPLTGDAANNSASPSYPDAAEWAQFTGIAGEASKASHMHRMRLNGAAPPKLLSSPKPGRPPRPRRGENILAGHWRFGSYTLEVPDKYAPWGPPFPSLHFGDRIHRFHWLRDLQAIGGAGERRARSLVLSWINAFGKWDANAWNLDITPDRVINWLTASPLILAALEDPGREAFLDSLARQARHLQYSIDEAQTACSRFRAAVALTQAGLCLPECDAMFDIGLTALEQETKRQILADGGHVTRSPSKLAECLIDLHVTEDLILRMGRPAPDFLSRTQTRMQNMLKFLTTPDGGLVVANGGSDGWDGLARVALAPYGDGGGRFAFAQQTGFHRVQAEDLNLYLHTSTPPEPEFGYLAHASCLALSIQDGPFPIVTSMGAHNDIDPKWRHAARQTAANSTLELNHENSSTFERHPETGLLYLKGPPGASARRLEEGDQYLLEGQHDGWRAAHGLIHRRRLYVSKDGARITGEDSLYRPLSETSSPPQAPLPFRIRFQLHPSVEYKAGDDDRTLYLGLGGGARIWRFRSEAPVQTEESVYTAGGARRSAPQITISGMADPESDGASPPNRTRWALSRIEPQA